MWNWRILKSRLDFILRESAPVAIAEVGGVGQNACRVSFMGAMSPIPSRVIGDQQLVEMGER
jgi:hypothetical protein